MRHSYSSWNHGFINENTAIRLEGSRKAKNQQNRFALQDMTNFVLSKAKSNIESFSNKANRFSWGKEKSLVHRTFSLWSRFINNFFLYTLLLMKPCMMMKFCSGGECLYRIYHPFCAVPCTSVDDFSRLQFEYAMKHIMDQLLLSYQWLHSIKSLNLVRFKLFWGLFLCTHTFSCVSCLSVCSMQHATPQSSLHCVH